MDSLISISIAILAGLFLSRVAKKLGLPAVTAYLVAGVLIGPYCLGRLGLTGVGFSTIESTQQLELFSDVALGFIAFSIGNEFRLSQLKSTGRQATIVAIFQALTATVLVDLSLFVVHLIVGEEQFPLTAVLVLGAIATATAPAATLMVVRQYKADGPLTRLLLPIVALDDAVGLIVFAVSFGIAKSIASGEFNIIGIVINPLIEIIGSLLLGTVAGLLFNYSEQFFHSRSKRLSISVAYVMLTVAISMIEIDVGPVRIGFSSLLTCMMLGTIFCNICDFSEELMTRVDRWSTPLLVLFFVLSGAELELGVFTKPTAILIGVVYIVFRSSGKYLGAAVSSKATGCSSDIVKYLGITLFPQAGVALGMCSQAAQLPGAGELVRNVTLFSVLVYELVGPMLTKKALTAAGEIKPEGRVSRRGNSHKD